MRSIAIGILLTAIIVSGFVLIPGDFVNAAEEGLVPNCGTEETGNCGFCDLFSLASRVLAFIVYLAVIFSTVMFAIVGIIMMTNSGKPELVSKAKSIFGNVFIGLIIVLSAWLLVDTLLKIVTNNTNDLGRPWEQFTCSGSSSSPSFSSSSRTETSSDTGLQAGGVDRRESPDGLIGGTPDFPDGF